jgi:hypothetical protein
MGSEIIFALFFFEKIGENLIVKERSSTSKTYLCRNKFEE